MGAHMSQMNYHSHKSFVIADLCLNHHMTRPALAASPLPLIYCPVNQMILLPLYLNRWCLYNSINCTIMELFYRNINIILILIKDVCGTSNINTAHQPRKIKSLYKLDSNGSNIAAWGDYFISVINVKQMISSLLLS